MLTTSQEQVHVICHVWFHICNKVLSFTQGTAIPYCSLWHWNTHKSYIEIILRIILTWGPLHHHVTSLIVTIKQLCLNSCNTLLHDDDDDDTSDQPNTHDGKYDILHCYLNHFELFKLSYSIWVSVVSDNERKIFDIPSGNSVPQKSITTQA